MSNTVQIATRRMWEPEAADNGASAMRVGSPAPSDDTSDGTGSEQDTGEALMDCEPPQACARCVDHWMT